MRVEALWRPLPHVCFSFFVLKPLLLSASSCQTSRPGRSRSSGCSAGFSTCVSHLPPCGPDYFKMLYYISPFVLAPTPTSLWLSVFKGGRRNFILIHYFDWCVANLTFTADIRGSGDTLYGLWEKEKKKTSKESVSPLYKLSQAFSFSQTDWKIEWSRKVFWSTSSVFIYNFFKSAVLLRKVWSIGSIPQCGCVGPVSLLDRDARGGDQQGGETCD